MWAVRSSLVSLFVLGFAAAPALAENPPAEVEEMTDEELDAQLRAFEESLDYQTGTIALPCGKAELALPEGYRYLDPENTSRVLEMWGNPPTPDTEGMLVAVGASLFEDDGWAVVLTYSDEGHVDDSDAASIDYDELLVQMKADTAEDNRERERLGLATGELIGWAEPPHYDAAAKKLYWAKELHFSENHGNEVNYAVRVLGREGVLELNAVGSMSTLASLKPEMAKMLAFSDFTAGNRYADYRPGVDRDSGYGVAALVAGGAVAAKVVTSKGFWAVLVAFLVAAKKALVLAAIAIAGFFKMLWSKLRGRRAAE
jgi:uncharacterized membrane-anchored protein